VAEKTAQAPEASARADIGAGPERDGALQEGAPPPAELVEAELLVEDVSIDGMCGVY
jgi:mycofactocin precursor